MKLRSLLALASFVLACSRPTADTKPANDAALADSAERADEHEALPKKVHLSAKVVDAAKIQTAPATKAVLSVTLSLPGEVAGDPDKIARISSPVAGRIEQIGFKEGSAIAKGDPLAVIRVPELGKVRAAYSSALVRASAARANTVRLKTLWEQRLAAEQSYIDAKANAESLDAEAQSLGDQLAAMGAGKGSGASYLLVLRAPITGMAISREGVVGQPITAEQVVGTIADLSEVWFLGRVFEKDLGRLSVGAAAEVQLNAYPKEHFAGSVEFIGRQIDPVARTLTARIRLTNRNDLLRIGLFGAASVATEETEKHEPLIVVPRSAVTEIGGKSVVFVGQSDGEYESHDVTLGDAALGKIEIVAGLREGEQVVVDGAFTLKSLVLKSAIAEEE